MKRSSLIVGLVACLGFCGAASATLINFAFLPNGDSAIGTRPVLNQYEDLGVLFRPLDNDYLHLIAAPNPTHTSCCALTHPITTLFPSEENGIRGIFSTPVDYLSMDLWAYRAGSHALLTLNFEDGSDQTFDIAGDRDPLRRVSFCLRQTPTACAVF